MITYVVYTTTAIAIGLVAWAVNTHNKYVAAVAQMGQLQERESATQGIPFAAITPYFTTHPHKPTNAHTRAGQAALTQDPPEH